MVGSCGVAGTQQKDGLCELLRRQLRALANTEGVSCVRRRHAAQQLLCAHASTEAVVARTFLAPLQNHARTAKAQPNHYHISATPLPNHSPTTGTVLTSQPNYRSCIITALPQELQHHSQTTGAACDIAARPQLHAARALLGSGGFSCKPAHVSWQRMLKAE